MSNTLKNYMICMMTFCSCAKSLRLTKSKSWFLTYMKYIIHIRALDQALKHGLILEKIHRVIEFNQSAWLKPYIDFNTELRKKTKNDFEKEFFKLMNNSVFGKTMENIRKQKDIKLVTNKKMYLRTVMKPNFKSGILFGENLLGCEMGKIKVVMMSPCILGRLY